MFNILTDQNGAYDGLAWDRTNAYIEVNGLTPRLVLQDGQNINTSYGTPPVNLCNITENRAVNGCNGACDGNPDGSCYQSGGYWYNGRFFDAPSQTLTRGNWHFFEAYFKMNTISNNKGQPNGIVQAWIDGQNVINLQNVIIRTNQYPTMKFNQFIIAPWIGDGSPVDQTFWVDNLLIANSRLISDNNPPSPPTGVRVE